MVSGRRGIAALAVAAAVLAGCQRSAPDETVRPDWSPVTLPVPPGKPGPLILRDAVTCAGRWYAVGAVGVAAGETRPAAWTSADGRSWTPLRPVPKTYYGHQNILYSAACRDGRLAVIGAKIGGAHANPRTSTWRQLPDGSLIEIIAGYTLYGGASAVNVARMTGGPPGWLIAGNRTSGAAAWVSPDAAEFRIVEAAPELASDERGETWAFDGTPTAQGWLLVGGLIPAGRIDRDPLAWVSADGLRWQRQTVAGSPAYEEFQRVAVVAGAPLAVGLRGPAFGAWRWADGTWRGGGEFGASEAAGVRAVRSLVPTGDTVLAVTSDGKAHSLWASPDAGGSWRPVRAPAELPAGSDRAAAVAADQGQVVLVADDAKAGRMWLAPIPSVAG